MLKLYTSNYIFVLIFIGIVRLHAEDFTHHFSLNNTTPYVKEAIILTLDLNQTNKDKVLFFHFTLKQSPDYEFYRLTVKETDTYHAAKVHYAYLIYPLRKGEVQLHFNLVQKATSDANLAYSFSGDRDNVKGLTTVDTNITLPPLSLNIKALPKATALVGDFSLTHNFKKHEAAAYEPLPFQVRIKGSGYPPLLENLLTKAYDFTLFKEEPIVQAIHTFQGTQNTVTYPMALSHAKSFTLEAIGIQAFNPATQKSYTLNIPKQQFKVSKVDVNSLIDKVDNPKPLQYDYTWFSTFFSYILVFVAGFLTALSWRARRRRVLKTSHPLKEKVETCKEAKQLLQLLMATDSKAYSQSIEKLESSLYGNGKISLNKVKEELLKELECIQKLHNSNKN